MRVCPQHVRHGPASGLWRALLSASLLVAFATAEKQENGLDIETTTPGECSLRAGDGDVVSMHYTGTLESGKVFDSSYKRDEPFEFKLGEGMVIEGWDVGLLGMCLGEERRLIIPPDLAYGGRRIGHIPPHSTLTFETKLIAINGVTKDILNTATDSPATDMTSHELTTGGEGGDAVGEEEEMEADGATEDDNGECRLLGPFALFVQAGLGILALSSVVFKRWRERPRRPLKIWSFDVSKQVLGSFLLHLLNIMMSMVSSEEFQLAGSPKQIHDNTGHSPNPCSFYLINIAVDTTLGIAILVLILKILTFLAGFTSLARPRESIKSGWYGHPPRTTWWLKQSLIYFIGLVLMKLCVLGIFTFFPGIALVGEWALRWTEGSEALQIAFVMFVFPLIMNAIQYYIIDMIIKDSGDVQEDISEEGHDHESREPLQRTSEYEEGSLSPRESEDAAAMKGTRVATVKTTVHSSGSESDTPTEAGERKQ